mgnify:CR=1 FL=1
MFDSFLLPEFAVLPVALYKSLQGKYFVGYADSLTAAPGRNAWAGLFNPVGSGVILFVNVITVTNVMGVPFAGEFWFNALFPGTPVRSELYTPSNTTIRPLPAPKVSILELSEASPIDPSAGTKIYSQLVDEESTVVFEENGKYIFPEGGSLIVRLNEIESETIGRVAFGWWEEPCL